MKKIIKSILIAIYKLLRGMYRVLPLPQATRTRIRNFAGRAASKFQRSLNFESPEVLQRYLGYEKTINDYKAYKDTVYKIGKKSDDFVEYMDNTISFTDGDVKPIAFYLPQFHTIAENDEWWGKGFTEWTNVTKAFPRFTDHYQPQLPIDMGFYDLSNIDVMRRQVELAKNYGIYGFCFHYYWFSGKRLLEKPLENFLNTREGLDLPFCICWANENWSRRWDGYEEDVLIAQNHSEEDSIACITDICRYIKDERYIRVDGKPLIIIYRADIIPNVKSMLEAWRNYCRENGIGEIHIIGAHTFNITDVMMYGFDGGVEFPPHFLHSAEINHKTRELESGATGIIYDMDDFVNNKKYMSGKNDNLYKALFPSWDSTPRKGSAGFVFQSSPELYKMWLSDIILYTMERFNSEKRYVFINAWNEWAEGAHLEPDIKYGYAYLQKTADVVMASKQTDKAICYFDHDMGGGANQYLDKVIDANQAIKSYVVRYNHIQEQYIVTVAHNGTKLVVYNSSSFIDIKEYLISRKITKIVINNLVSYPSILDTLTQIIDLKNELGIELVMNTHDYFAVCPVFFLLDENYRFCGLSGFKNCDKCKYTDISKSDLYGVAYGVSDWRLAWGSFLVECDSIVVFSNDSKNILEMVYGELKQVKVIPHEVDYIKPINKRSKTTDTLNIGFIGQINLYTG